jgi:ABC-2 type transport system permease protein
MRALAKAAAIAATNLRLFTRDRSNVFFVFILPIGIVLLVGAQFSGDFSPAVGVSAAETRLGADLTSLLEAGGSVTVREFSDEADILLAVERGSVAAAVVVPADADAVLASGSPVELGFVSRPDGFGPQLQSVVADALSELSLESSAVAFAVAKGADPGTAAAAAASRADTIPTIAVTTGTAGTSLFEGVRGRFDIGASSQLVLFMFLTGLAGSAAVIQSRQLGVTRRMLGSPTSVGTVIAGEAIGRFAVTLTQGLYIVAATVLLFGVGWGNLAAVAAILVAFAAVGAGAAMLFGSLFRNDQQAGGVAVVVGLGMAALGGSMLPIELFGPTMTTVAHFTPHAWANDAFAELLRRDGTTTDILPQLGALALYAAALLLAASWRMRAVITRT